MRIGTLLTTDGPNSHQYLHRSWATIHTNRLAIQSPLKYFFRLAHRFELSHISVYPSNARNDSGTPSCVMSPRTTRSSFDTCMFVHNSPDPSPFVGTTPVCLQDCAVSRLRLGCVFPACPVAVLWQPSLPDRLVAPISLVGFEVCQHFFADGFTLASDQCPW